MQTYLGRCGGQVVSILAFNSDDPISNPSDAYSFFCKITNENKKVAGVGPFLNANVQTIVFIKKEIFINLSLSFLQKGDRGRILLNVRNCL